ncbi:MAG TPA: AsmA family protein [Xanthobacteraceae bacterium]
MQTTLLGLAIALILALVTAIVAPLVVDWNRYRDPIEAEASRLTGMTVRINGSIDGRLVPTPMITLHDVVAGAPRTAGAPAAQPLLRAGEIKLELALSALLRGKIEATDAHVIEPEVHVGLDRSGALTLSALAPSSQPENLSIGRFSIENGRVVLADAASGARLVLQKFWFDGEVASFAGPFSGRGAAVVGDRLYGYRISGSPTRGGTQIRLGVDPSDIPLTTQFDGTLKFAQGVPSFDGALAASRPVGATLANGERVLSVPWRATGAIAITPSAAKLQKVTFRYGPEERGLNFTGSADVTLGRAPRLVGKLSAMGLDVDRALAAPDVTDRPPLVVIRSFLPAFLSEAKLPMRAKIALSVDSLTLGGTTLDSLSGDLDFDQGGWTLDHFQLHAPGLTQVNVSGRLTGAGQGFAFKGPAKLASADFETLLAWLAGASGSRAAKEMKTFTAQGDVTLASDRIAVEQLKAALGEETVAGRLAYQWSRSDRPARVDAELRAASLDLDALSGFASAALGGGRFGLPQEATLALDIGSATLGGIRAQAINATVKLDAGRLQIDRLAVGDLAGAKLALSGQIDALSSRPQGQLTLDLDAAGLDGLSGIAARFAPQAAAALRHAADRLAPAKVHAVLDVESAAAAGSSADLHLSGSLAAMRIALDGKATGRAADPRAAAVQIDSRIDADDGAALVALLGLDRVIGVDELPGRLTLAAKGPLGGDLHVDGKVEASGLDSALTGTLRLSGHPASWGNFQVRATAADLRPLHRFLTGQPGAAAPVTARAALAVGGGKLAITDIVAHAGQSSLGGHVAFDLTKNPVGIDGDIKADAVDAPAVAALLLGLPATGSDAAWSNAGLGGGVFAPLSGAVTFKVARAALTPSLAAQDLAGVVHFTPSAMALDDIEARLAGGRLDGSLAFQRNADGVTLHTRLGLTDVAAGAIASAGLQVSGGDLIMALTSDGAGATPAALVGSLHGSGTVTLKAAQFSGLDPAAFEAARQAAGQNGPIDLSKVQAAVKAVLARGHLIVPQGEGALSIASGVITLKRMTLQAQSGAELALADAIDLNSATSSAQLTLSQPPPAAALIDMPPELSISVTGPLAAPLRTLDLSVLNSWLSLSAAELQTRRIDMIEANRQQGPDALAPPAIAPDVHTLSPGTVLESELPPKLRAAPVPGARGLERLRFPPAPPPATPTAPAPSAPGSGAAGSDAMRALLAPFVAQPKPSPRPRARKPAAAVGAAETPPQSAPPSSGAPRAD